MAGARARMCAGDAGRDSWPGRAFGRFLDGDHHATLEFHPRPDDFPFVHDVYPGAAADCTQAAGPGNAQAVEIGALALVGAERVKVVPNFGFDGRRAAQDPALRDLARWLYRQLEAEYYHLASDEAIEEGIIVNEYTFTEAGRRFG